MKKSQLSFVSHHPPLTSKNSTTNFTTHLYKWPYNMANWSEITPINGGYNPIYQGYNPQANPFVFGHV